MGSQAVKDKSTEVIFTNIEIGPETGGRSYSDCNFDCNEYDI